jgi:nicotinate dehydrogenase subunit A
MAQKFTLNVNGTDHTVDVDPDMPLLYALRNDIGRISTARRSVPA